MNKLLSSTARRILASAILFLVFGRAASLRTTQAAPVVSKPAVSRPVILSDNGNTWTLDNAIVKLTVYKKNSNLQSLIYQGINIVPRSEFWEQTPSGEVTPSVIIDPEANGGERAEVAVYESLWLGDARPLRCVAGKSQVGCHECVKEVSSGDRCCSASL